ncbi:MAG: hypothetical protein ACXWZS_09525 [Gemmatirosa sp.]
MSLDLRIRRGALLAAALALTAGRADGQGPCAGRQDCAAVASFVAVVTDFRPSTAGYARALAVTVRFQNRTDRALRLTHVLGSGIATDDQGNRYQVLGAESVRGMGVTVNGVFDPKFELQPGEASDARFEFTWRPTGREIIGTRFTVELAVREIVPVGASQLQLGREHALQWRGFGAPAVAAAPFATPVVDAPSAAPAGVAAAPATIPTAIPAATADACAGAARCYGAGPFTAQLTNVTSSRVSSYQHHVLRFTVRLRNLTAQPLVLAYKGGSNTVADELGNRYYWGRAGTYDGSATGIGVVQGRTIDPQFVLGPGQARDAQFEVIRYNPGRTAIGQTFTYDLTLAQLEPLNGGQVRVVRDYTVGFRDLREGAVSAAAGGATSSDPAADAAARAGRRLFDGIRKKVGSRPQQSPH